MKKNNTWAVVLVAFLMNTPADATDPASDLAKKLSPEELAAIEREAAKLKEGKQTEAPETPAEQPQQKSFVSETKKQQPQIKRERSLRPYETMHQGFYPGHDITQKPIDSLTQRSIKPLDGTR